MTNEELLIRKDRMRFIKNKASSNLAILGILFNVLYFVSIYQYNGSTYYFNLLMGASLVYNLVFLLAAFLSSEGIKNYDENYAYLLIALGIGQLIRIFILPVPAHSAPAVVNGVETVVMENSQFFFVLVCLILSAVCCLASAVIGIQKSRTLKNYLASMKKTA